MLKNHQACLVVSQGKETKRKQEGIAMEDNKPVEELEKQTAETEEKPAEEAEPQETAEATTEKAGNSTLKDKPANRLDPRIKMVWRIRYAVPIVILGIILAVAAVLFTNYLAGQGADVDNTLYIVVGAIVAVLLAIFVGIVPTARYKEWSYEITDDCLDIMKGSVFKKSRSLVPFVRIRDTDTQQTFLMDRFGLASVTASTMAHEYEIPGLDVETADQLRNRVAELATAAQKQINNL